MLRFPISTKPTIPPGLMGCEITWFFVLEIRVIIKTLYEIKKVGKLLL